MAQVIKIIVETMLHTHLRIHMQLYIYVAELFTHSWRVWFDVYNDPSGWKDSYLNSDFAGKNTKFQRNLPTLVGEKKQLLILNVISFAYLWSQSPFSPGKTKFLILLKLSVFVKPSSRHTWMIPWVHVAHEAAVWPSKFSQIGQSLCIGLS